MVVADSQSFPAAGSRHSPTIAERLGISRFRVARLLDSARDAGMVRIEIGLPGGSPDTGLSAELCSAFGLK